MRTAFLLATLGFGVVVAVVSSRAPGFLLPIVTAYAVVMVVFIVVQAISDHRRQVRRHRIDFGLCPACGYDLRGSKAACPECGAKMSREIQ